MNPPRIEMPPPVCAERPDGCQCDYCQMLREAAPISRREFAKWLVDTGRLTDDDELTGPERAALREMKEARR